MNKKIKFNNIKNKNKKIYHKKINIIKKNNS